MIEGRTILLTGGAGFIGTALARRLLPDNRVVVLDNGARNALAGSGLPLLALARAPSTAMGGEPRALGRALGKPLLERPRRFRLAGLTPRTLTPLLRRKLLLGLGSGLRRGHRRSLRLGRSSLLGRSLGLFGRRSLGLGGRLLSGLLGRRSLFGSLGRRLSLGGHLSRRLLSLCVLVFLFFDQVSFLVASS